MPCWQILVGISVECMLGGLSAVLWLVRLKERWRVGRRAAESSSPFCLSLNLCCGLLARWCLRASCSASAWAICASAQKNVDRSSGCVLLCFGCAPLEDCHASSGVGRMVVKSVHSDGGNLCRGFCLSGFGLNLSTTRPQPGKRLAEAGLFCAQHPASSPASGLLTPGCEQGVCPRFDDIVFSASRDA